MAEERNHPVAGVVRCPRCGFIYCADLSADRALHQREHRKRVRKLKAATLPLRWAALQLGLSDAEMRREFGAPDE